jgi:hypothetical protein
MIPGSDLERMTAPALVSLARHDRSPGAHVQLTRKPLPMKHGEHVAYAVMHILLAATAERLVLLEESPLFQVVDIAVQIATEGDRKKTGDRQRL